MGLSALDEVIMHILYIVSGVIALVLLGYLIVALLKPEWLE